MYVYGVYISDPFYSVYMQNVVALVQRLCDVDRKGGRCVVQGIDTIYVYDTYKWTNEMTEDLQRHYPCCVVNITQSASSLSGFVVVIENKRCSGRGWTMVTVSMMFMVTYLLVHQIMMYDFLIK